MRVISGALVGCTVLDYSSALTFHAKSSEDGDSESLTNLIDGSKCFFDGFDEVSCLTLTFPPTYLKDYGGSLMGDDCTPPIVNEADVRNSLDEANGVCRMFGQHEAPTTIDDLVESIIDNVSNETCWESLCLSTMNDNMRDIVDLSMDFVLEGIAMNDTMKDIVDLSMDFVLEGIAMNDTMKDIVDLSMDSVLEGIAGCADVELDSDSCIVVTTIDMILPTSISKADDFRRALTLEEGTLVDKETRCIPPTINTTDIGSVIRIAEDICQQKGEDFYSGSSSDVESALKKLFSNESCWVDACTSITEKYDNVIFQAGAATTVTLDFIDKKCASVQLNRTSCVQNEMVAMLFNSHSETQYHSRRELKRRNEPLRRRKRSNMDQLYDEFGNGIRNLVEEVKSIDDTDDMEKCVAPFNVSDLQSMIDSAVGICDAKNFSISNDDRTKAHSTFSTLLEDQCWESICSDDPLSYVITNTLESCLEFVLPEIMTHANRHISSPTPEELQDQRLACMIDYVMSTDPIEFGLDRPPHEEEMCFPPGYQSMSTVCSVSLAPVAMEKCPPGTTTPDLPFGAPDMSFSYAYDDFSYAYDGFSMSYDYMHQEGSGYQEDIFSLVDDFCSILERMSSPEGQKCLKPLCFDGKALNLTNAWNPIETTQTEEPIPSEKSTFEPVPSEKSTFEPVPSEKSTFEPVPSEKSTGEPVPSDKVTLNPSSAPSKFIPPAVMTVTFEAFITIELDNELPEDDTELKKIANVLEEGLSEFLPENSEVTVTRINGIKVPRRRLAVQGGVEIEFEVVISSPCDDSSCSGEPTGEAESLYVLATEDLKQAVSGGTLAASIKRGALEEGVTILQNIVPSSFEAQTFTTEVVTKSTETSSSPSIQILNDDGGNDDDDDIDDDADDSRSGDDSSASDHVFPYTLSVWVYIVGSFMIV